MDITSAVKTLLPILRVIPEDDLQDLAELVQEYRSLQSAEAWAEDLRAIERAVVEILEQKPMTARPMFPRWDKR